MRHFDSRAAPKGGEGGEKIIFKRRRHDSLYMQHEKIYIKAWHDRERDEMYKIAHNGKF